MEYINRYEEWLKVQKIGYIRFDNLLLREYGSIIIPLGPIMLAKPKAEITPTLIFNHLKGKLVWWSYYNEPEINPEWYAVIKKNHLELSEYASANTRNQIKKGLKHCCIEPINIIDNAARIYEIYQKANAKRGIRNKMEREAFFLKTHTNAMFADIIKYWGIYCNEQLVGYAVVFEYGKFEANISEIRIDPDFNKNYPSYALFHVLSEFYLKTQNFASLSDGYRSLAHNTNIQQLLISKFGFIKQELCFELAIKFPYNLMAKFLWPIAGLMPITSVKALLTLERIKKAAKK